jgi:hypothetical protein
VVRSTYFARGGLGRLGSFGAFSHLRVTRQIRQVTGYRLLRVADSFAIGKIGVCGIAGDRTVRLLMAIK